MDNIERKNSALTNVMIGREHAAILDSYKSVVHTILTDGPSSAIEKIQIFYKEYLLEHIANEEYLIRRSNGVVDARHLEDHRMIKELYESAFGINPATPEIVDVKGVVMEATYIFELAVIEHWKDFDNHSINHH